MACQISKSQSTAFFHGVISNQQSTGQLLYPILKPYTLLLLNAVSISQITNCEMYQLALKKRRVLPTRLLHHGKRALNTQTGVVGPKADALQSRIKQFSHSQSDMSQSAASSSSGRSQLVRGRST